MKRLDKKGFTLIELLAVIVILGVLMLIAIPAVTRYINESRKKTFISNASSIMDAAITRTNFDNLTLDNSGKCYLGLGGNGIELEKTLPSDYKGYVVVTKTASTNTYLLYLQNDNFSFLGVEPDEINDDTTNTKFHTTTSDIVNSPNSLTTTRCY